MQLTAVLLLLAAVAALGLWVVRLERRIRRVEGRYREVLRGPTGAALEEILNEYAAEVALVRSRAEELVRSSQEMQRGLGRSIQGVGVVRFNPFSDTGGDQSFAIALLDGHGDGVVMTGLHARSEGRVYAKPVVAWSSHYALSEEERQAIAQAQKRLDRGVTAPA